MAVLVVVGVIVAATLIGNAISGLTLIDDLESGDCVEEFFEQSNGEFLEVFFVRTVNCETPHAYEVYSSEALWDDSDTFAGSDQTFAVAEAHCLDEYHEFVGGDYYTSDYETWSFAPTSDTWSYGDRTTICLVGSYDGVTLLEGSLRGADA